MSNSSSRPSTVDSASSGRHPFLSSCWGGLNTTLDPPPFLYWPKLQGGIGGASSVGKTKPDPGPGALCCTALSSSRRRSSSDRLQPSPEVMVPGAESQDLSLFGKLQEGEEVSSELFKMKGLKCGTAVIFTKHNQKKKKKIFF